MSGEVLYKRRITKYMPNSEELDSSASSMFDMIVSYLSGVHVLRREMEMSPGVAVFMKRDGQIFRVKELSQIFLIDIPWGNSQ